MLCNFVAYTYFDAGLGHVTCFGQWEVSEQDAVKNLKSAFVLGWACLLLPLCLGYENMLAQLLETQGWSQRFDHS